MKELLIFSFLTFYSFSAFSQLSVSKKDGGTVITKLGMGVKVNEGSSLLRDYITINDENCPVQLNDVGIETTYFSSRYSFKPSGDLMAKEPIAAYEVIHLIYNVFGEHMKTLSNKEIKDIEGKKEFSKYTSWYASENNVSAYLICVSYVSNVRTKDGKLWKNNFQSLKDQLNKLEISFEEEYLPKKDIEKEK